MREGQDKSGAPSVAAAHTAATGPPDEQYRQAQTDGQTSPILRKLMTSSAAFFVAHMVHYCLRHSSLLTPDPEPAESSHFQLPLLRRPRL